MKRCNLSDQATSPALSGFSGICLLIAWLLGPAPSLLAHGPSLAEQPRTHLFSQAILPDAAKPHLWLEIVDAGTGQPCPARFTLEVDGKPYVPDQLGPTGIRVISIHTSKGLSYPVTYTRGTGPLYVPLPASAREGIVRVSGAFEYLPMGHSFRCRDGRAELRVELTRWINLAELGWQSTDEHVHFDRLDRSRDGDWLTMMRADGLSAMHVLTLEGANLPDLWARQFAYGKGGEASDGWSFIRPGEEFRNPWQGHFNLLGISQLIEPVSTGTLVGPEPLHWPPPTHILRRARELGGARGIAHGGAFGLHHTGPLETALGEIDFIEILNPDRYLTALWYRMLNTGHSVVPAAGTDLPNSPARAWWQPFLGSVRCYVQVDGKRGFASWREAFLQGRVFVSSGPVLFLTVNGEGPGSTIRLPEGGGPVEVEAVLSGWQRLEKLMIIRNGQVFDSTSKRERKDSVEQLVIRREIHFERSGWLAAQGVALPGESAQEEPDPFPQAVQSPGVMPGQLPAHTGVIRVLVGDEPIGERAELESLLRDLTELQIFYERQGAFATPQQISETVRLFREAIAKIRARLQAK